MYRVAEYGFRFDCHALVAETLYETVILIKQSC